MAAPAGTATASIERSMQGRELSSGSAALDRPARPSCYECDPEAQDLSMQIFKKLDANSSGYLESPHEVHCALEVMLGMYSTVAKPLSGRAAAKNYAHLELAETLSAMLKQFNFEDGRMDFFEWDAFAQCMYEAAGRPRYWSIASLWAERLAHEAPQKQRPRHKGNLMRNLGPDSPRPRLVPQKNTLRSMDAEARENLPQLPSARGRFQLTSTKSGSPRESARVTTGVAAMTSRALAAPDSLLGSPAAMISQALTAPDSLFSRSCPDSLGVDGALPPSNGSPPATACSSRPSTGLRPVSRPNTGVLPRARDLSTRQVTMPSPEQRTLGELGVSPPRRRRRMFARDMQESGGFGADDCPTPSACSSNLSNAGSPQAVRSVTIPGKMLGAVLRPATTPCQQTRWTVDCHSTWPPAQTAKAFGRNFHSSPPCKMQAAETWHASPQGTADSSGYLWQHRWQLEDASDLLKRDNGMLVAMHKLRTSDRIIRHASAEVVQEAPQQIAVQPPEEAKPDEAEIKLAAAISKIQARFRGSQARIHAKATAHNLLERPKRRTLLLEHLKQEAKRKKKGKNSRAASPAPEEPVKTRGNVAGAAAVDMDPALLQVQLNVAKFLKSASRKKNKQKEELKGKGEYPLITVDELWDIVTSIDGSIKIHLEVREMLDIFHECKRTGLDLMMAKFLPQEHLIELVDPNVEPEDLSPGEVSHLCMMMINQPEFEMGENYVRQELNLVKDDCREADYKDIVNMVPRGQYLSLVLFRRLIHYISMLMQIDEAYIMAHIAWCQTGHFELTDTLAALIIKHCARKCVPRAHGAGVRATQVQSMLDGLINGTRDTTVHTEDDHNHDHDEDVLLLLDERFSGQDFSRMCHAVLIVDPRDKVGLSFSKINALFSATVRIMQKEIEARVALRPQLQKNWKYREQEALNADATAYVNSIASAESFATERHALVVTDEDAKQLDDICEAAEARENGEEEKAPTQGPTLEDIVFRAASPTPGTKARPKSPRPKRRLSGGSSLAFLPRPASPSPRAPSARPSVVRGGGGGIAEFINGRTEFSVLIQETYKAMPHDIFLSPLQMCVEFLQTCSKGTDLFH